jgi:hypothetical protein
MEDNPISWPNAMGQERARQLLNARQQIMIGPHNFIIDEGGPVGTRRRPVEQGIHRGPPSPKRRSPANCAKLGFSISPAGGRSIEAKSPPRNLESLCHTEMPDLLSNAFHWFETDRTVDHV